MKRDLVVSHVFDTGLYEIKFQGGGPTPYPLHGFYTTRSAAERAIANYLQNRDK